MTIHVIHDDLIIAAPAIEEHDIAVEHVLELWGLTLNPEKCIFRASEVPFWGIRITDKGIMPDPNKVDALQKAETPNNKEELISFLCMLQSNAEFIPQLSMHTQHLHELTNKHQKFQWDRKHQTEFDDIKALFCRDTLNRFFNPDLPTFIFVDADHSGLAQGSSISTALPISMASRATTKIERRYPQLDLEGIHQLWSSQIQTIFGRRTGSNSRYRPQTSGNHI